MLASRRMTPPLLPPQDSELGKLMRTLPRSGRVRWIGLRPRRDVPMQAVDSVLATPAGLDGDRYGKAGGKRGITLIQAEHLPVIAALAGLHGVEPATLRRNVVVEGLPLVALKGRRFRIGDVLCEGTGDCDPCSRMEAALGAGGFNAMRGHGGLTARIVEGGRIRVGDRVEPLDDVPEGAA
jgi:MOSC domain-containing protein YiiM